MKCGAIRVATIFKGDLQHIINAQRSNEPRSLAKKKERPLLAFSSDAKINRLRSGTYEEEL